MTAATKPVPTDAKSARLKVEGKELELPVIVGSEGEKAINISNLRDSGYITIDEGYVNTSSDQRDHLSGW